MIEDIGQGVLIVFGSVVTLAIISIVIGKNSQAPQAIQAASGALAQIVAAAVNPAGTNAANPVSNNQSIVTPQGIGTLVGQAFAGSPL